MFQRMRLTFLAAISLLLIAGGESARAQSEIKGQRVFSAGHSFHFFMPPILAGLAKAAKIEDHKQAVAPSETLRWFLLHAGSVEALSDSPSS